jgi:hypothetical protein
MMREALDEPPVEVDEAEEGLDLFLACRCRPIGDSCYLDRVHLYRILGNDQAQVFYFGLLKLTLRRLQEKLVLPENLQDSPSDLPVLLKGLGEDEYVIHIDHDHSFRDEILENLVHHGLEGGRAVGVAEEHDQWLEKTPVGPERGLPLVSFLHLDVIKAPSDVKFGEVLGASKLIDEFRDEGEWVPVLDHDCIESPVVLHQPESSVFLLDERHRGLGRPDASGLSPDFPEGRRPALSTRQGRGGRPCS